MQFDLKRAIAANWPIKLTALVLATVLWAAVEAEEPTTQLIPVSVTITTPARATCQGCDAQESKNNTERSASLFLLKHVTFPIRILTSSSTF